MAHWAEIDKNNIVIRVLVTDNNEPDEGYQWLVDNLGGTWIKASYNSFGGVHYIPDPARDENGNKIPSGQPHLRYNYPGPGFLYNEELDAFVPPKPFNSFILDENTCWWKAPIPYPNDGNDYEWNESNLSWDEVIL